MNAIILITMAVCFAAVAMATQMGYGYQSYVPVHMSSGVMTTGTGFGSGGSGFGFGGTGGGLFDMIFFRKTLYY